MDFKDVTLTINIGPMVQLQTSLNWFLSVIRKIKIKKDCSQLLHFGPKTRTIGYRGPVTVQSSSGPSNSVNLTRP
jgi:hypothetical protein